MGLSIEIRNKIERLDLGAAMETHARHHLFPSDAQKMAVTRAKNSVVGTLCAGKQPIEQALADAQQHFHAEPAGTRRFAHCLHEKAERESRDAAGDAIRNMRRALHRRQQTMSDEETDCARTRAAPQRTKQKRDDDRGIVRAEGG